MIRTLVELDTELSAACGEAKKAWHVSNGMIEFFDLRDEEQLSEDEIFNLKYGYHGAALDHDILHDYIVSTQRLLEESKKLLGQLWEQVRSSDDNMQN